MSRALWEALGEAVDACEAANDEYAHAPTPETRAAMAAAAREYAQRLYPLIGEVEAFRYEASLATYLAALGHKDEAAAGKDFAGARVTLDAALERAIAHDNEPDEKGGA